MISVFRNNQFQYDRTRSILLFWGVWIVLSCCSGCDLLKIHSNTKSVNVPAVSLLQNGLKPQGGVGIEIFVIRIPAQNRELLQQLWMEVDEQMISPGQRRDLMDQGLRIGVQGSLISPALTKLINVTANKGTQNPDSAASGLQEISVSGIKKDFLVHRQQRNLLPEMRAMIKIYDDPLSEMPLFWSENGRLCGKTYKDAQGLIGLTAKIQNDQTVRFTIIPELEYGTPETNYRIQSGVTFLENGKPRRTFETLGVSLNLILGQWIVLGPVSTSCSGIGRCFFIRETGGDVEQKIIAFRLTQIHNEESPFEGNLPIPQNTPDHSILERN